MIASAQWKEGMLFEGRSQSGHTIIFDASAEHASGPSPKEAVLAAMCACTSADVVSILKKKREPLAGLTVSASAEQAEEEPRVFTKIHLIYRIYGKVGKKSAEDAVALSKNKYCSISQILEKSAEITYSIEYPN
ncbi:MAG: OsmC family protein [Acidobacteriaceae bacterium]